MNRKYYYVCSVVLSMIAILLLTPPHAFGENEAFLGIAADNSLCLSDYNNDKQVNLFDFAEFGQNYKTENIDCSYDLVGSDCYLNLSDFAAFANNYNLSLPLALGDTKLTPKVMFQGSSTQIVPVACTTSEIQYNVVNNNEKIAQLDIIETPSPREISLSLAASQEGEYQLSLNVAGDQIQILDIPQTSVTQDTTAYFPYNWNDPKALSVSGLVRPTNLIPGIKVGNKYITIDSPKLSRIGFTTKNNKVTAEIYKSLEVNNGWDTTEEKIYLSNGSKSELNILIDQDLGSTQDRIFEASDTFGERGIMTVLHNKGWACEDEEVCSLSREQYETIADNLSGKIDIVAIRSYRPQKWIAEIFSSRGITPYLYTTWGTVRIGDEIEDRPDFNSDWLIKDTNGKPYMHTNSAKAFGNWYFVDIRKQLVRDTLIANSVNAINSNYKGILLDIPFIKANTDGKVGGDSPGSNDSYIYSKWLFLKELSQAIKAVNPGARLGMLGNKYFGSMHTNDYLVSEGLRLVWEDSGSSDNPAFRNYNVDLSDKQNDWPSGYTEYIKTDFAIGSKSSNPLLLHSTYKRLDYIPHTFKYFDHGDMYEQYYLDWSLNYKGIADHQESYISEITGQQIIHGEGLSLIRVDDQAKLTLNRPLPVIKFANDDIYNPISINEPVSQLTLQPNKKYIIAERKSGNWYWSGYGFAYNNSVTTVYGDIRLLSPPSIDNDLVRFSAMPGISGHVKVITSNKMNIELSLPKAFPAYEMGGDTVYQSNTKHTIQQNKDYYIAHLKLRSSPWFWAEKNFAYLNNSTYVIGDNINFVGPPAATKSNPNNLFFKVKGSGQVKVATANPPANVRLDGSLVSYTTENGLTIFSIPADDKTHSVFLSGVL